MNSKMFPMIVHLNNRMFPVDFHAAIKVATTRCIPYQNLLPSLPQEPPKKHFTVSIHVYVYTLSC